MAFSSTITQRGVIGNKRYAIGTYDCTAVTGGNINTGLERVDFMQLQPLGAAVQTDVPAINETLPLADGTAVTIVTVSGDAGIWFAIGR